MWHAANVWFVLVLEAFMLSRHSLRSLVVSIPFTLGLALAAPLAPALADSTDIVVTFDNTAEIGSDTFHSGGGQYMTDDQRMPFSITQDISHGFKLYFQQTYLSFGSGRAYNAKGQPTWAPGIHDNKKFWGVRYSKFRFLDISAGMIYRYRMCCPAAMTGTTPVNDLPVYYHGVYAQLDYRFGPTTSFGKMFAAMANIVHAEHQPTAYYWSPAGQATLHGNPDVGAVPNYNYAFRTTLPLSDKYAAIGIWNLGSDYYTNTPAPEYANVVQLGLLRKIDKSLSAQAYFSNAKFHIQGYPPLAPQALHHAEFHVQLTYEYGGRANARRPVVVRGTGNPQPPPHPEPSPSSQP